MFEGKVTVDESLQLAVEVAHRILDSQDSRISENSQLFTDLVEMVRGHIRGEPMFPDLEMRGSFPVSTEVLRFQLAVGRPGAHFTAAEVRDTDGLYREPKTQRRRDLSHNLINTNAPRSARGTPLAGLLVRCFLVAHEFFGRYESHERREPAAV